MSAIKSFPASLATAVALTALAGCHSYVPVQDPSPGMSVRAHVPLRAAVEGGNRAPESMTIDGKVLAAADTLVLETASRRELATGRILSAVDTVRIARTGLVGLDQQVFSKPKTLGLTALVVVGATGLVLAAIEAAGGQEGDDGPGDPGTQGAVRVPLRVLTSLFGLIGR